MRVFKLIIISVFMVATLGVTAQTRDGEARINMQHVGHHGTHSEYYPPADMPEVYFDADNLEITLVADGFSTYYNVEIFLTGYNVPVISTQVDGYGDTIDVSSLTDNDYDIVITSEFNNRFVGQFTVE